MVEERVQLVYEFDELSKDARESAISTITDQEQEYMDLSSFSDDAKEQLIEQGFNDIEVSYSLSYSQGDGFSFTGEVSDEDDFISSFKNKFQELKDSPYIESVNISVVRDSHQYSHENTIHVDVDLDFDDAEIEDDAKDWTKTTDNLNDLAGEFEDVATEWVRELCKQLEKQGYEEIEFRTAESTIIDLIKDNDYKFDEDGNLI